MRGGGGIQAFPCLNFNLKSSQVNTVILFLHEPYILDTGIVIL